MKMDPMRLDSVTAFIIDRLNSLGYEANLVGGSVRNHLLGLPVTDVDITTSATPEETKAAFSDCRVIETGIKHGTVTVLVSGTPCEITTYRSDGEYLDNRHPSSVSFTTSLSDDLSRRDFTVNAICYNPRDGYTDLFDGIGDLGRHVIRAIGDPETRFREDALRILRALRFASVLGFEIHPDTSRAIIKSRVLLNNVSRERIFSEWEKLLGGERAYEVIGDYSAVIATAIPELCDIRLPKRERFLSADAKARALAIFYLSTPDPVCDFERAMLSLHTDNATRLEGCTALRILPTLDLSTSARIAEAIYDHGLNAVDLALRLGACLGKFGTEDSKRLDAVAASNAVTSLSDLAICGGDLVARGIRGKAIGDLLDRLVRAVIRGELTNTRDDLLEYIDNHLPKAE